MRQKAVGRKMGIWYELRKNRGLYLFMLPGILYTFIFGYVTLPVSYTHLTLPTNREV